MAQIQGSRDFVKPETVVLRVRVNKAGTRKPTDVTTVALTRFEREGTPIVAPATVFTREAEGEYSLSLGSGDLPTGTYSIVATITGPAGVVVLPDTFVLRAA